MEPKIKIQKDYYMTEVSLDLSTNLEQMSEILKSTGTTGKMVVQYNQGPVQGINIEQRTRISDAQAEEIRKILGIGEKIL